MWCSYIVLLLLWKAFRLPACIASQEIESSLRGHSGIEVRRERYQHPNICPVHPVSLSFRLQEHNRELQYMKCPSRTTRGVVLYNAVVNVHTNRPASCGRRETLKIEAFLEKAFDDLINDKGRFKRNFQLSTNFCDDSRRRRQLAGIEDNWMELEEDEGEALSLHDAGSSSSTENLEEVSEWNTTLLLEDTAAPNESEMEELSIDERDLGEAKLLIVSGLFLRGNGKCILCNPDNWDHGRHLADDETYFYRHSDDMQDSLNRDLTSALRRKFNRNGCLKGKSPRADVHLVVVGEKRDQTKCQRAPSVFCCAPKANPQDVCSKHVFGDGWYCHESKSNCQGSCDGVWVDALNPPTCLGHWAECTDGGTCCPGSKCVRQNRWYSQCTPR